MLDSELKDFCHYCALNWDEHVESSSIFDDHEYRRKLFTLLDQDEDLVQYWADWTSSSYAFQHHIPSFTRAQHVLAAKGYSTVLRCLNQGGTVAWDARDRTGSTALMYAVYRNRRETVSCLIALGASVNARSDAYFDRDCISSEIRLLQYGLSALHIACVRNNRDMVELLLENGADHNSRDKSCDEYTPLELALKEGHLSLAVNLIDKRAGNLNGALRIAAQRGEQVLLSILISDCGAENLDEALWEAARYGRLEVVRSLLELGANFNELTSRWSSESPLSAAISRGHMHVAHVLIEAGADIDTERQLSGRALSRAVLSGCIDMVKQLLHLGANINFRAGPNNECLVCIATRLRERGIIILLLEAGADYHH